MVVVVAVVGAVLSVVASPLLLPLRVLLLEGCSPQWAVAVAGAVLFVVASPLLLPLRVLLLGVSASLSLSLSLPLPVLGRAALMRSTPANQRDEASEEVCLSWGCFACRISPCSPAFARAPDPVPHRTVHVAPYKTALCTSSSISRFLSKALVNLPPLAPPAEFEALY